MRWISNPAQANKIICNAQTKILPNFRSPPEIWQISFGFSQKKRFDYLRISIVCCTFAASKELAMRVTFNEEYLEELYTKGKSGNKKYRFQPQIVRGYQKAVKFLIQAQRIEDLFPFKSLHFEALHGDKEGRFSVKANDQYRVEFSIEDSEEEPVVTICNVLELSNHYK